MMPEHNKLIMSHNKISQLYRHIMRSVKCMILGLNLEGGDCDNWRSNICLGKEQLKTLKNKMCLITKRGGSNHRFASP